MPSSQTGNYALNQWAKTDRIQMSDFNADNAKIDAALAATPKIAVGTYTGTGTFGESNANTLTFEFVPRIVFIVPRDGYDQVYRAALIHGCTAAPSSDYFAYGISSVVWDDDSRSVTWYAASQGGSGTNRQEVAAQLNSNGVTYLYLAIG